MKLEYVASGTAGLRFSSSILGASEETHATARRIIAGTDAAYEQGHFSMLFNALMEPVVGETMHTYLRGALHNIHADSGGLQEITLGKKINDYKDIYAVQRKFSDIAMCFDKIPVEAVSEKVAATDTYGFFFNKEAVVERAAQTGRNIVEQIDYMRANDVPTHNTEVSLILQGNCFDSFQTWVDTIADVVGDKMNGVGNLAMSDSALGHGFAEDVKRFLYLKFLDLPDHLHTVPIHLLGIGSLRRLMPIAYMHSFYMGKHISYDSTSLSSALHSGRGFVDGAMTDLSSLSVARIDLLIDEITNFSHKIGVGIDCDPDFFIEHHVFGRKAVKDYGPERNHELSIQKWLWLGTTVSSFIKDSIDVVINRDLGRFKTNRKMARSMKILEAIEGLRDVQDMREFENGPLAFLDSKAIPSRKHTTYELF